MQSQSPNHRVDPLLVPPWSVPDRESFELSPPGRSFESFSDERVEPLPLHVGDSVFRRGQLNWPDLAPWHFDQRQDREHLGDMIHDEAATSGIDVLAWYVSYRAYAGQWGIFLREDAIVGIGEFLTERHRSLTPSDAADAASRLLMAHEYFHFLVDIGAEVLEDMLGVRLYATWQEESRRRQPPYDLLEEALANAFAYRHGKTRGLAKPTRDFLTRSPVGYRDFGAYVRHDAWSEGLRDLLSALESCAIEPADRPGRWGRELFIDEQQRLVSPFNIPVWLVRRTDQPIWLHLITALGPVTSTATYRRDIARLPAKARDQLQRAVDMAQAGVTPKKLKRLTGYDNRYRLRSGDYRAILDRDRGGGFVAIRAGHRKNIYKGLPA